MRKGLLLSGLLVVCWIAPAQAQFPMPPSINMGGGVASPRAKEMLREADAKRNESRAGSTPAATPKATPKATPTAQATPKATSPNMTAPLKVDTWAAGKSLHQCASEGNQEELDKLLKAGASLKIRDKDGATPLHAAVGKNQVEMVKYLLTKSDVDINAQESRGMSSLMLAAASDHEEMVKVLLEKGADVKLVSNDGSTALHRAASSGRAQNVALLLAAGADPRATDKKGRKASEVAEKTRQNAWSEAVDKLQAAEKKS